MNNDIDFEGTGELYKKAKWCCRQQLPTTLMA
jgi:hypothetical protein